MTALREALGLEEEQGSDGVSVSSLVGAIWGEGATQHDAVIDWVRNALDAVDDLDQPDLARVAEQRLRPLEAVLVQVLAERVAKLGEIWMAKQGGLREGLVKLIAEAIEESL